MHVKSQINVKPEKERKKENIATPIPINVLLVKKSNHALYMGRNHSFCECHIKVRKKGKKGVVLVSIFLFSTSQTVGASRLYGG